MVKEERTPGTLTNILVLTINSLDEEGIKEFENLAKDLGVPLYISRVEGFSIRPELRLPEGYLFGKKDARELIEYVSEHGNYKPFLDRIN